MSPLATARLSPGTSGTSLTLDPCNESVHTSSKRQRLTTNNLSMERRTEVPDIDLRNKINKARSQLRGLQEVEKGEGKNARSRCSLPAWRGACS